MGFTGHDMMTSEEASTSIPVDGMSKVLVGSNDGKVVLLTGWEMNCDMTPAEAEAIGRALIAEAYATAEPDVPALPENPSLGDVFEADDGSRWVYTDGLRL